MYLTRPITLEESRRMRNSLAYYDETVEEMEETGYGNQIMNEPNADKEGYNLENEVEQDSAINLAKRNVNG